MYGLRKEVRAVDKQGLHLVGDGIAGRVEDAQFRPKHDGLAREFTPAKDRRLEIDIGKKRVDVLRGSQERQRLVHVARRKRLVAPVLDHHLRDFADEHIVFDNQDHGHQNSFCHTSIAGSELLPVSWLSEPLLPLSGLRSRLASDAACNFLQMEAS